MDYSYDHYKYEAEERRQRANRQRQANKVNEEQQDYVPRRRRR